MIARATVLVVLAALVAAPTSAYAAQEVQVSRDGRAWSTRLAEPLFDQQVRWVPGDRRVASFWVRNHGPSGAVLQVRTRVEGDLAHRGDVTLRARTGRTGWVDLGRAAPDAHPGPEVPQGGSTRVDVEATFDPAAANQTQRKQAVLGVDVILVSDRVDSDHGEVSGQHAVGADRADDPASLPGAGTTVSAWLLVAATAALLVGARLVRRRVRGDRA